MFMIAMVRICSWVGRWNVLFNEAEPNWMEHSCFQRMKIFALLLNEKDSLFVLYKIQVDLCHFDWRIQLSKQTKRRPTIFNCEITPVLLGQPVGFNRTMCVLYSYFETRQRRMYVPCSNTAALPKTCARGCFYSACNSTFQMERKKTRWMERKMHGEWRSVQ